MIYESSYWKEPLLAAADFLSTIRIDEEDSDDDLARVEREILIGFYSVRKLLDTFKVSSSTKTMNFGLRYFEIDKSQAIEGVFVASDRARSDRLYFVSRERIFRIFRAVGNDYSASQRYHRNAETGQWQVGDAET